MIKLYHTALIFVPFAALVLTTGCATHKPTEEIAAARQAIQNALTAGTEPSASPSIAVAQQKLSEAEDAMDGGRYPLARRLSEEAVVDAEYAQVQSEALRASESLQKTVRANQVQQEAQ